MTICFNNGNHNNSSNNKKKKKSSSRECLSRVARVAPDRLAQSAAANTLYVPAELAQGFENVRVGSKPAAIIWGCYYHRWYCKFRIRLTCIIATTISMTISMTKVPIRSNIAERTGGRALRSPLRGR